MPLPTPSPLAFLALLAGGPALAQPGFIDVTAQRGLETYAQAVGMGGGVAAADYDDDGDIDLFVPNACGSADQLYRNLGNGHFEEIAGDVGLASTDNSRTALWVDHDADGRLDLVVARDNLQLVCGPNPPTTLVLHRQLPDGTFDDVTVKAGLGADLLSTIGAHCAGLAAGDVDRDGYPDLCLIIRDDEAFLFLNDGDGTFTDISVSSGIGGVMSTHFQPIFHDFDGDGWQDIYVTVDFQPNRLWINQHDDTFVDMAPAAGVDNAFNDMGITLGDHDNDGDLDIFITNIYIVDDGEQMHNVLYRNDSVGGTLAYTEVAETTGTHDTSFAWGTTFLDYDNDGWLELAVTNGFNGPFETDRSSFFVNQAGDPATFVDVASSVGFNDTDWGSALVALDSDRDGDLDVVQTCALGGPARLLENQAIGSVGVGHWLVVRPRMEGPNRRALGAVVRARAGGLLMTRLITAGTSYLGQEPAEAFFGLGAATSADEVTIEWTDGTRTNLVDVGADQVITVVQPWCRADVSGNDAVEVADLLALLGAWGPNPGHPADLDGNGQVGIEDLLEVLGAWGDC
jgi:hypothetical protein